MEPSGCRTDHEHGQSNMLAGLVQALSEGLRFARAAGLDPQRVIDVVSKDGPAAADGQPAQNNDSGRIQFRFCSGVGAEGSAICLDEARRSGASLPVPRWWIGSRARSGRKAAAVATYQVSSPAFRLTN